jgi:hypothetical protein
VAKFRYHRGSLKDSMETVIEVKDKNDLLDQILSNYADTSFPLDRKDIKNFTIQPYGGIDKRIGWNTYIVEIDACPPWGRHVAGFTNGPLE